MHALYFFSSNIQKAQEKRCSKASTEESLMKTELFVKKKRQGDKPHVVQYSLLLLPCPDESSGAIHRMILTSPNLCKAHAMMLKFAHLMEPLAMSISIMFSSSLISDKMSMKSLLSRTNSGRKSARRSCSFFQRHCSSCPT